MFLKRITVSGFKSFAESVDFDFGPGITCVVGPNGCGKSNIVDAFKWVLGEQSAKSLRGKQMLDMIFAGSATRKASGVAQVNLIFDNTDASLPIETTEVTISRKLYRSGESEYLLNGQTSRLKDIRELFFDTGVATEAYSVIEQGRVDHLLRSSPQDRRAIFEEAAGISRYKARRKEAEGKLARTEQNLSRVRDILAEQEKRLRSIKLQAGKARSFKEYDQRLRELRSEKALADYFRLQASFNEEARQRDRLAADVERSRMAEHEAEHALEGMAANIEQLSQAVRALEQERIGLLSAIEAQRQKTIAATRRLGENQELLSHLEQQRHDDADRLEECRRGETEAKEQVARLEADELRSEERVTELFNAEGRLAEQAERIRHEVEQHKAEILEFMRASAQFRNENAGHERHRTAIERQISGLSHRLARIDEEHAEIRARMGTLCAALETHQAAAREQQGRLDEARQRAETIDRSISDLAGTLGEARDQRTSLISRRDVLLDLEKRMEGVDQGVQALMRLRTEALSSEPQASLCATFSSEPQTFSARTDAPPQLSKPGCDLFLPSRDREEADLDGRSQGNPATPSAAGDDRSLTGAARSDPSAALSDILGLIADFVAIPAEHAAVVELALGEDAQCVLFGHQRFIETLASDLRALPGRIRTLALDALGEIRPAARFLPGEPAATRVIDLVPFDGLGREAIRPALEALLADTFVVQNLAEALTLRAASAVAPRIITRDGDIFEPNGRIIFQSANTGVGLISRRSELRQLDGEINRREAHIRELDWELSRLRGDFAELGRVQDDLRGGLHRETTACVQIETQLRHAEQALERLDHEKPLLIAESEALAVQCRECDRAMAQNLTRLAELQDAAQKTERALDERQAELAQAEAERRKIHDDVTAARVESGRLREQRKAARERVLLLEQNIREMEKTLESLATQQAQCEERAAESRDEIADCEAAAIELQSEVSAREERLRARMGEKEAAQREQEEARHHREELRDRSTGLREQINESNLKTAAIQVRLDELISRTREDLAIELAERAQAHAPEEQDWAAVETEIAELKDKIRRLGNVNLDALDELDELQQRYDFQVAQRDDLEQSAAELVGLIERLNEESRERFESTFQEVRENFRTLFRKLFSGGRADIVLEDPELILESGVDIVAQPPGKELQNISLMSGGEKTMTAIALVMSIFKTRPSPCALLDEVDAALDEANNERFNQLIREFTGDTQFIVITHSKRTMSIGDVLYGITMQEPGVSTRISVRLSEAGAA